MTIKPTPAELSYAERMRTLPERYARAVRTLQEIASLPNSGARALAHGTLLQLGEPVEPEGYVPGRGFEP